MTGSTGAPGLNGITVTPGGALVFFAYASSTTTVYSAPPASPAGTYGTPVALFSFAGIVGSLAADAGGAVVAQKFVSPNVFMFAYAPGCGASANFTQAPFSAASVQNGIAAGASSGTVYVLAGSGMCGTMYACLLVCMLCRD